VEFPPPNREKKGRKRKEKGKDPRGLLIPPGARSLEYKMAGGICPSAPYPRPL